MSTPQQKVALQYIAAFETLSPETFQSLCTSTCTHSFAPSSIAPAPMDNEAFTAHITKLKQVLQGFPVTPKEVMQDETQNKVIIWATSQTEFYEDVKDSGIAKEEWYYRGEYVFIFTFDETERKIEKILEFFDSKGTERLIALMQRAGRNKAAKGTTGA